MAETDADGEWREYPHDSGLPKLLKDPARALFGRKASVKGVKSRSAPAYPGLVEWRLADGRSWFRARIWMSIDATRAIQSGWPFSAPICAQCGGRTRHRKRTLETRKRGWSPFISIPYVPEVYVPSCGEHEGEYAPLVSHYGFHGVCPEFLWQFAFWNTLGEYPPMWIQFGPNGWRAPSIHDWRAKCWIPFWVSLSDDERTRYRRKWGRCDVWPEAAQELEVEYPSPQEVYNSFRKDRHMPCHGSLWRRLIADGEEVEIPTFTSADELMRDYAEVR